MALLDRVAIIGAAGQLGSELMKAFAPLAPVGLDRAALDIESPQAIEAAFERHAPTLVIDTAAFHDVGQCEAQPERAFAVNAVAVERLAATCARAGAALAFISTDYVFDGSGMRPYQESDDARPLSVYGVSKLAGERLTLRRADAFVFRTSGLYGVRGASGKRYTFVQRILEQARANQPIRVVDDVTFSPSYAVDAAAFMRRILEAGIPGLYHTTNAGHCTWFEFASAALRLAGLERPIEAVSHTAFDTTVRRPSFSALDNAAARAAGVAPAPAWEAGLAAYLDETGLRERAIPASTHVTK